MAYVLTGVEQGASLSDNNVARNYILVYRRVPMSLSPSDKDNTHRRTSLHPGAYPASRHGCVRYRPRALLRFGQPRSLSIVSQGLSTSLATHRSRRMGPWQLRLSESQRTYCG
jgi:hypothetical protein